MNKEPENAMALAGLAELLLDNGDTQQAAAVWFALTLYSHICM